VERTGGGVSGEGREGVEREWRLAVGIDANGHAGCLVTILSFPSSHDTSPHMIHRGTTALTASNSGQQDRLRTTARALLSAPCCRAHLATDIYHPTALWPPSK
jgi:hypothetical protein